MEQTVACPKRPSFYLPSLMFLSLSFIEIPSISVLFLSHSFCPLFSYSFSLVLPQSVIHVVIYSKEKVMLIIHYPHAHALSQSLPCSFAHFLSHRLCLSPISFILVFPPSSVIIHSNIFKQVIIMHYPLTATFSAATWLHSYYCPFHTLFLFFVHPCHSHSSVCSLINMLDVMIMDTPGLQSRDKNSNMA
jgi:hypothetical protein